MTYKEVIKDSKFFLPMNLNLGYLLTNDTDIVVLMNVINCDTINEKLSVRKLMRYTNRSNNTIQKSLTRLRTLKLIQGFRPKYETLKYIFDSINNKNKIEDRKKWCESYIQSVSETSTNEVYQNLVQNNVSETDTKKCIENWYTDKEDIEKKDEKKKDVLNNKNDTFTMENIMKFIDETLTGDTENVLIDQKGNILSYLNKNRIPMGTSLYNRASSYLNRKYKEKLELVTAEAQ